MPNPKDNNFLSKRLFGINIGGALDEAKTYIGAHMTPTQPPPSTMAPQGVDAPYTPKYPLEEKSLNALGEKITGVVEDPRNTWIGMGPMAGVIKGAKIAGKLTKKQMVEQARAANVISRQQAMEMVLKDIQDDNVAQIALMEKKGIDPKNIEEYRQEGSKYYDSMKDWISSGKATNDELAKTLRYSKKKQLSVE